MRTILRYSAVLCLLASAAFAQQYKYNAITGLLDLVGSSTGTGTVTSIAVGCGLSGGTITTTGTIARNEAVRAQTGTSYTFLDADCGKLVTHTNASAIADTLPQANGSTFIAGWFVDVQNRGAGLVTITSTTSTIDGAATLVLGTKQGVRIVSDGTNYFTVRGVVNFDNSTIIDIGAGTRAVNTAVIPTIEAIQTGAVFGALCTGTNAYTCTPTQGFLAAPLDGSILNAVIPNAGVSAVTITNGAFGPYKVYNNAESAQITTLTATSHTFVFRASLDTGTGGWVQQDGGGSAYTAPTPTVYASLPACDAPHQGLQVTTDVQNKMFYCSGTTLYSIVKGRAVTAPPTSSWSAIQCTNCSTSAGGPDILVDLSATTGLGGYMRAYTGGDTIEATIESFKYNANQNGGCGFAWGNGSTAAADVVVAYITNPFGAAIGADFFTGWASYSASPLLATYEIIDPSLVTVRYREDVTNRFFDILTGNQWVNLLTQGKTTNLTTTHVGFACYSGNSGKLIALLKGWKVN